MPHRTDALQDEDEVAGDGTREAAVMAAAQPRRQWGGARSAASREWGAFVAASKTSQVKDVWDVKGADLGPRESKKQLEEMTARFRAAAEGKQ